MVIILLFLHQFGWLFFVFFRYFCYLPSRSSLSSLRASRLSLLSCRSISWLIRFCSLASSDMQHVMFQSVRVAQPPASIIWGEPWPSLQSPWPSLDGDATPWRLALACTRHSYDNRILQPARFWAATPQQKKTTRATDKTKTHDTDTRTHTPPRRSYGTPSLALGVVTYTHGRRTIS